MAQPDKSARQQFADIAYNIPIVVRIPGTRRRVKIYNVKPYTLEALTRLWLERDASVPEDSSQTLKSLCKEPFFAVREACLFVLNSWWGIRFIYPLMWRIWAYLRGYTEEQVSPIIQAGKKKVPLSAHWTNMAFTVDMRADWKMMTAKEAEQYRAELLSEAKRLSLKSSPATEASASA